MSFFSGHVNSRSETRNLKAFEMLYNEHYESLCHYAQRFVYDLDTARTIVQDVFVNIWEKRTTLLGEKSLKAYLYRSVRNRCLDYLKHQVIEYEYEKARIREIQGSVIPSSNVIDHPLDGLITKELEFNIKEAIKNLPDKRREIFELSRYKGLKYREIADALNISVKTVETQMSRAIQSLKKQLSNIVNQ
jgi:RNA polymerase sigma-70 factor (ECF subfamily)